MANNLHLTYRPDIDGLRAVAVFAVLLFHLFPEIFKSGFIGVDIFFVISGFLITSIVSQEIEQKKFSLKKFYERRIRRIIPSLNLVIIFTILIGLLVFFKEEFKELCFHVASGMGFVANLALWSEAGYFDAASETKPLLHLWSLGVEEQFYFVWPFLLYVTGRSKKLRSFTSLVCFGASLSFCLLSINSSGMRPEIWTA